ncbi:ATP-dependent endonuclease [Streptomyces sp. S1A]|uniref:ATP-dependent nuclease n=1 Tax=Streptomyces sp. ICN903 TaxID=2964654 RepID=UPI001EDC3ABB|nr:ATP-dependent endonuclease [Streptomyces sp. ICN903]MCG3039732.1 ATP-dependent endonuclease [Streptomyces sp. ICN903]
MKIKRVRIENFRCLRKVDVDLEDITSFLGPTGAGKSTVLRALDWFFNGEKVVGLSEEDLHSAGDSRRITVEVEFDDLTERDREALGRYAPPGADSVIIWRTWEDGEDKITGKGLAYPPFETIRQETTAMDKRRAYAKLREEQPGLGLPSAGSAAAVDEAMRFWELDNRERLTQTEIAGTHFFGFAGQSRLAELIDFVFVSADLRAYEEADDNKSTVLGRILDHAVDRTEVSEQIRAVEEGVSRERKEIHSKVYGDVLDGISDALSREVAQLTAGRAVRISPMVQVPKPVKTLFRVRVQDGAAETSVHRQGHGFQRALIIGALKHLAERKQPQGEVKTLCLAIEEPELFQHPAQARTFADVLRELVVSSNSRTQVMYATHSPVFIDHRSYHKVRRLTRDLVEGHPTTMVSRVTEEELCSVLEPYGVRIESVKRQAGVRCVDTLAEGFFADAAVLMEGETDAAVILGCAERQSLSLGAQGITFVSTGSKSKLMLCHAILRALNVHCYTVFDGDAGLEERKRQGLRSSLSGALLEAEERKIDEALRRNAKDNANLLGYLGGPHTARPTAESTPQYTVFEDSLETYLASHWPAWEMRRRELVNDGEGFDGKNAATYREAARTASTEPPGLIQALLENVRALVRHGSASTVVP